jgi:hypothetical protein
MSLTAEFVAGVERFVRTTGNLLEVTGVNDIGLGHVEFPKSP